MSLIRSNPQIVSCLLIQFRGGENVVIGEYPDYDAAYKAARDTPDDGYRVFKTIETFTRTREVSFNHNKRSQEAELLRNRDDSAAARAAALSKLTADDLNQLITNGGDIF